MSKYDWLYALLDIFAALGIGYMIGLQVAEIRHAKDQLRRAREEYAKSAAIPPGYP